MMGKRDSLRDWLGRTREELWNGREGLCGDLESEEE